MSETNRQWVLKRRPVGMVNEEDVQHGFENIPATLTRLFTGQNLGKQLLQLGEPASA